MVEKILKKEEEIEFISLSDFSGLTIREIIEKFEGMEARASTQGYWHVFISEHGKSKEWACESQDYIHPYMYLKGQKLETEEEAQRREETQEKRQVAANEAAKKRAKAFKEKKDLEERAEFERLKIKFEGENHG